MFFIGMSTLSCSKKKEHVNITGHTGNTESILYNEFKSNFSIEYSLPLDFNQNFVFNIKNVKLDSEKYKDFICSEINNCEFVSSYMRSSYYPMGIISSNGKNDFFLLGFFDPPFTRKISLLIGDPTNGRILKRILLWEDDQIKKRVISKISIDREISSTYIFDTTSILGNNNDSDSSLVKLKHSKIKLYDDNAEIIETSDLVNKKVLRTGNIYELE
ncbi:hypothetical protein [Jejuia spongiicola]|uniref:Lipoprotein n=1 Tax=Jejuia spongiicola TaxID=2942207 RepID=A0ABT0QCZ2_9FLAO|nr:hypothetical protein [Jejuia spongiicola]MCL6294854.1 hypothetical protein [Jejuia spongiicola]